MRKTAIMLITASFIAVGGAAGGGPDLPPEKPSPPGQIVVATVNVHQAKVLDVYAFNRLYALTLALRSRPRAFDGGRTGAVTAPDVIVLQEITPSNVEIFHKLVNQRSHFRYEIAATAGAKPKFLYNADTVAPNGPPAIWVDPCRNGLDGKEARMYQYARFTEAATGARVTIAGVHFGHRYKDTGANCKRSNVVELRRQMLAETDPVVVGGDFNYRPVVEFHECDPRERSEPTRWWEIMTERGLDGERFVDAVQRFHRRRRLSMAREWTHEQKERTTTCTGARDYRRSRIDYLFAARAVVAAAHVDHPGWAGPRPGTRNPRVRPYSDHRFVWGRFVLQGPPRPQRPRTRPRAHGAVRLSWPAVNRATGYVVYRARGGNRYASVARRDATETTFTDTSTSHGVRYRYAVAAVDAAGAQGVESRPSGALADAHGPRVSATHPAAGAKRVPRTATVRIRFDERVAASSVERGSIRLFRNGRRVRGRVAQPEARVISFDPRDRLARRDAYRVVVRPVRDRLGNRGPRYSYRFRT